MDIKYLVYVGTRESGELTVPQVRSNSPYRKLAYGLGMRLRIGVEIPEKVAGYVLSSFPKIFKEEKLELSRIESFKDQFTLFLKNYKEDFDMFEMLVMLHETIIEEIEGSVEPLDYFKAQVEILLTNVANEQPNDLAKILKESMSFFRKKVEGRDVS